MKARDTRREKNTVYGYLLPLTAMVVAVAVFAIVTMNFADRIRDREEEILKKAVTRASVQRYAIEGHYPPSVGYLEENYGVWINRKKHNILYDGFISNIMPEINIISIEEQGAVE